MSMKKKALMAASYVMVAAMAIGGTVAYLTDTDSDVNVMTLGNVQIEQNEHQRVVNEDGTYPTKTIDGKTSYQLEEFDQFKPLLPIVGDPNEPGDSPAYAGWDETIVRMTQVGSYGEMQVFAGKNAQDKFVTVTNTGKTDAYVRTLVAIEIGSTDGSKIRTSSRAEEPGEKDTKTAPWTVNNVGVVAIDGYNYKLYEYVYRGAADVERHVNGILPAGDTTYPSLCQVYLKHNTTGDDIEAIDANANGRLDIRVLSQAVQADGFEAVKDADGKITKSAAQVALDAGFGEVTAANAKVWFEADETVTASPASGAVRPAGHKVSTEGEVIDHLIITDNSDEKTNLRALYNGESKDDYTTEDIVIMNSHLDGTYAMNLYAVDGLGAELVVTDTELKGWVSYTGFASAEFTKCTFDKNTNAQICKTIRPYDTTVFTNCNFAADYEFAWDMLGADDTVTFVNCTIGDEAITDAKQVGGTAAVTVK